MANDYEKFNELYQYAMSKWASWQDEAREDLQFYLGLQWNAKDRAYLRDQRRNAYVFNRVHRMVKFITGYQRKNRLAFKVDPTKGSSSETASQQSQVLQTGIQRYNGYNLLSEAFEQGCLKTGLNFVVPYIDFSDDIINGDVRLTRLPYTKCLVDPDFTERDLSDADYFLRRELPSKEAAKAIFPKRAKDIENLTAKGMDGKYTDMANIKHTFREDRLRYDEYWQREYVLTTFVVDTQTNFKTKWTGSPRDLKVFITQFPQFVSIKSYEKNIRLKIFLEEELFYNELNPGDVTDFPHVPVMGFFDSEYDEMQFKLQSVIRCMKDPAVESNKRRSQMLDIMESIINTGWIAEEKSVVNEAALYGSGQGQVIFTHTGKQKPEKIIPGEVPSGMFQAIDLMDRDQMEIPGGNQDVFGVAEKDVEISYVLAKMRQSSSITILQDIFDNYHTAKKLVGEKALDLMKINFTKEKVEQITGRPITEDFFDRINGRYDMNVAEGVFTETQRQMNYLQLVDMRKNLGINIPDEAIIQAAPIERKDELLKTMQDSAKAAAEANKINTATQAAEIESEKAKAAKDQATAVQKAAQAKLNEAQTISTLAEIKNKDMATAINLAEVLTAPSKQLTQR